ncbi:MAG: hypothetical protein NTV08_11900 [Verrucomicrobia bacterium]|nr:hypothetical protein [Verrucomicrobiota bacterium]
MKPQIAAAINVMFMIGSGMRGFMSLDPGNSARTNVDIYACTAAFLGFAFFAVASPWSSLRNKRCEVIPRPSFFRVSIWWWSDPLQCLWLSIFYCGAMCVGALLRAFSTTDRGLWLFWIYVSMFAGLLLGTLLAHWIFRKRIERVCGSVRDPAQKRS